MNFTTLNHLCFKVGDGLHGTPIYDAEGSVPFINGNNLKNGKLLITESTQYIHDSEVDKHHIDLSGDDTLLLQINGTIGNMAFYNDEVIILGKSAAYLRFKNPVDRVFCYYYLQLPNVVKGLYNIATGSTIKNLGLGHIKSFKVFDLPNTKKKNIAEVLSTLDAKIDLNNRINAELESLARTIYDYWFLQFDFPGADGRPYRSSGGEMRFDEELGREVPVGWATLKISNFLETTKGNVNPFDFPEKTFKHYSLPTFDATGTYGIEKGVEIKSNKNPVKNGDLLVSKLNPWFNRVIYVAEDEDAVASTEFIIWRNQEPSTQLFLRQIATSDHFIAYCTQNATGTSNSHKRVNPGVMLDYSISVESTVVEKYGNMIKPMISKITINEQENRHLSSLRDWLLPLLMSGEVVVGE